MVIKIIDENYSDGYAVGMIAFADLYESFDMPLDYWALEQYEYQWQQGLRRLKNHTHSCLVTAINNPEQRRYINWWLLYREGDVIYIQNHIIVGELYDEFIDKKNLHQKHVMTLYPCDIQAMMNLRWYQNGVLHTITLHK